MPTTQTAPDLAVHRPTCYTAAALLVEDDSVLLLRRSKDAPAYANMWDLPQVDLAPGDSPEDALVAGLRADLGVEVTSFTLLSAQDDVVGDACRRRFVYQVTGFTGQVPKSGTTRWYSKKEFADVFQLNPLVAALAVFSL